MQASLEGVARLSHLGVIRVQGDDAAAFLQGQLTQDFQLLRDGEARLAAYCTPKGRMLASFVGWQRAPGEFLLVCSADLLAATLKRLSMFVLRAKAKLTDATAEFALYGLAGNAAASVQGADAAPWTRARADAADAICLYPANGVPRALWCAPAGTAAPAGDTLDLPRWMLGEADSGVATITAAISEAFVPQMLNYESVGGVNFKKGCYPGQEVVARSQFRGTLKRRAYVATTSGDAAAGQDVWEGADAQEPCGTVAQAAAYADGGHAIVSMQVSAAPSQDLRLGAPDGPRLELLPLPYLLLADV